MKNKDFIVKKVNEITGLELSSLTEYDVELVLEVFASERPNMLNDVSTVLKDSVDDEFHNFINSKISELVEDGDLNSYSDSLEKKAGSAKEMNIAYDLDDGFRP